MSKDGQAALTKKFDPSAARLPGVGGISWDDLDQFEPEIWSNDTSEEWIHTEWGKRFK
jgi:hypothetical protein